MLELRGGGVRERARSDDADHHHGGVAARSGGKRRVDRRGRRPPRALGEVDEEVGRAGRRGVARGPGVVVAEDVAAPSADAPSRASNGRRDGPAGGGGSARMGSVAMRSGQTCALTAATPPPRVTLVPSTARQRKSVTNAFALAHEPVRLRDGAPDEPVDRAAGDPAVERIGEAVRPPPA